MVVVTGEEQAARDALRHPLLMQHQAVVVGDAQVEQRRLAGYHQIKPVRLGRLLKTVGQLRAQPAEQRGRIQPLHLVQTGDAGGERLRAHPVRAGERQGSRRGLELLAPADGGHVVAVGQRLAEADEVGLEAVVVVGTGQIEAETGAHVVDDEQHVVLVAEIAHALPVFLRGHAVVKEVPVVVGLGDERRHVAIAGVVGLFHGLHVKPRKHHVVGYVLGQYAGVVGAHRPGVVAVVVVAQKEDLALARVRAGEHDAEGGGVGAVFHEERPVRHGHGVHQLFGALHHFVGRRGGAVGDGELFDGGFVHVRVAIPQHIRAVGAHEVQIAVAVHVPEIRSLGLGGDQRPFVQRQKQALRWPEVAVDTGGDDGAGAVKPFVAFNVVVFRVFRHALVLLRPDTGRPCPVCGSGCRPWRSCPTGRWCRGTSRPASRPCR